MTTASWLGIVEGIITNLSAASVLDTGHAGLDYSLINMFNEPVAIVGWTNMGPSEEATFSGAVDRPIRFVSELFFKDTGNACALMSDTLTVTNKVISSIESDWNLQDTVEKVMSVTATKPTGEAAEIGGLPTIMVTVNIDVLTWPKG